MRALALRLTAAILFLTPAVSMAAPAAPSPVRLDEVKGSGLLFRTATPGAFLPVPLVGADVDVRIAGMAASVTLRQQYYNPTDRWLEAVYVFPLGEDGAVYRTRIEAGERVIEGHIAERNEARRTYERAAMEGRRAGLIEQERPNIFTSSVANIAPHDVVTIEIGYHEALRYADGRYRFRFPMVVAPRYIPMPPLAEVASERRGAILASAAEDAERITAPVLDPALGKVNPVRMRIALAAGFPLGPIDSEYHPVEIADGADGAKIVTLADGAVAADRDFELSWAPQPGAGPQAGAFRETVDGDDYLLVMLIPPETDTLAAAKPRELTLVIDTSGSMSGPSIAQAKEASGLALEKLRPIDSFNVIEFNSRTRSLFRTPLQAGPDKIAQARRFLDALKADGGTEMLPALRAALDGGEDPARLQQVILVTDGAVGNEAELFREVARGLGDRRLFTVGIGSAPNGYFLSRMANAGRGTHAHIGKIEEVGARMGALLSKIERPALTDIAATWPAREIESLPSRIPDLYSGDPIVLFVRVPGGLHQTGALRLAGRIGDGGWSQTLDLDGATPGAGIAALWGRAKIAALMGTLREGAAPDQVRQTVLDVALRHHLMSRYTSLVAVDTTPARPVGAALTSRHVPLNLPDGWDYEKLFGDLLPNRDPADRQRDASLTGAPVQAARGQGDARLARAMAPPPGQAVALPQGATPMALHLIAGMLASAALIVVLAWRRRSA